MMSAARIRLVARGNASITARKIGGTGLLHGSAEARLTRPSGTMA